MDQKIGWIVPSYPPRKFYLEKLVKTFEKYSTNVDLIVVWTRRSDNHLDNNSSVKHLYLQDHYSDVDLEIFEETKSIINVKKIFGIMMEYANYQALVCTDDELEFVRPFSNLDIARKFETGKKFPAIDVREYKSKNHLLKKIIVECNKIVINEEDRKTINKLSNRYSAYGWFADIPFYDCDKVPSFLKTIGIQNLSDLHRLNFFTFDHILYQFSCLLNYSYTYEILNWENAEKYNAYSWFECFHMNEKGKEYARIYQEKYSPFWTPSSELLGIFRNAICVFHLDRQFIKSSKKLRIKNKILKFIQITKLLLLNTKNRPSGKK